MREPIESILAIFTELSAVPRKSKSEVRAVEWLIRRAEERGLRVSRDLRDNIVIRVPARGCRSGPVTVLQGHIDMVCEKIPGSAHDFDTDPIVPVRKGDWITAEGTTLGADNGIAAAMALAAADDDSLVHPPLELLFTTDEESGMTGAKNLDPSALEGKVLLNLDSEDEGVFTVGCAGGRDCLLSWRAPFTGWPG